MMRAEYEDVRTGSSAARPKAALRAVNGPRMEIAGIAVEDASGAAIIRRLRAALEEGDFLRIAFLNAHCVNVSRGDELYREALRKCLVLPDGVGVDLGARILHGRPFAENLNGTDFVPRLLGGIDRPLKVALVGGAPGVAVKAAAALGERMPAHRFAAISDGYFDEAGRDAMLAALEAETFDIVLVALGVPAQEKLLTHHLDRRHGRILIGVGALFDFLAGNFVRAPRLVRALRLEWLWRLALEPGRLWRRYVIGNPRFVLAIVRDRVSRRGRRSA